MLRPTDFIYENGELLKKEFDVMAGEWTYAKTTVEELLACAKDESARLDTAIHNADRIEGRFRESEAFRQGVETLARVIGMVR